MTISSDRECQQIEMKSEFTAEELAMRTKKADRALQEYQQRLAAMTPHELESARIAERELNQSLLEARGLTSWE